MTVSSRQRWFRRISFLVSGSLLLSFSAPAFADPLSSVVIRLVSKVQVHGQGTGSVATSDFTDTPGPVYYGPNPYRDETYRGGVYSAQDIADIGFADEVEAQTADALTDVDADPSQGSDTGDNTALDLAEYGQSGLLDAYFPFHRGRPAIAERGIQSLVALAQPFLGSAHSPYSEELQVTTAKPTNGFAFPWEGSSSCGGSSAAPAFVNTQTGNVTTTAPIVGWKEPGDLSLGLTLYHNSQDPIDIGWGVGWRSSYDFFLIAVSPVKGVPSAVVVCYPDGRQLEFTTSTQVGYGNLYVPPPGFHDVVVRSIGMGPGTYTLRTPDQITYTFGAQSFTGGLTGGPYPGFKASRLTGIHDRYGNSIGITGSLSQGSFKITDQFGRFLTLNIRTVLNPNLQILWYGYSSIVGPGGQTWTLSNPVFNNAYGASDLTKITYPSLNQTSPTEQFAYSDDSLGDAITSETSLEGGIFGFTFDTKNRLTSATYPGTFQAVNGGTVLTSGTYSYAYTSSATTRTDPFGYLVVDNYNGGTLASHVDEDLYSESYTWDSDFNLHTVENKRQNTTTLWYDNYGNVTDSQTPLQLAGNSTLNLPGGKKQHIDYWPHFNDVLKVTDTRGAVTTYNRATNPGEVTSVVDDLNNTLVSYTYDQYGDVETEATDGATTTIGSDSWGRPKTITTPDRAYSVTWQTYFYDVPLTIEDTTMARTTTLGIDDWGRINEVDRSDAKTSTAVIDAMGRVTKVTDWKGANTYNSYDLLGRLYQHQNGRGDVQTFTWRDLDNVLSIGDGNSHHKHFTYTARGDTTYLTLSDNTFENYKYDADGNQTVRINGLNQTIDYSYDVDDNPASTSYPNGTGVTYSFDLDGRPGKMVDTSGTTRWTFDNGDRLTSLSQPNGALSYLYDQWGRRTSMTSPAGTITYHYTADKLTSIVSPQSESTVWTYDPTSNLLTKQTNSNGTYTQFSYDDLDRVQTIDHFLANKNSLLAETYGYDDNGNLLLKISNGSTYTYNYDGANQITSETGPGYSIGYTYDGNGNRLTKTLNGIVEHYYYDGADKLTSRSSSAGTWTYTYDLGGRLTKVVSPSATTLLGYDYEDRLTSIGVNGNNALYGYNALDARVSKIAPGQPNRTYLRDGTDAAADVISDGVASMVPGISERDANGTRVLHLDQLGTARLQTDANQNITNQFNSDAFGIPTQIVNPNGSQAAFAANWNYESDPESGLQLLGRRYYDPGAGRFITPDPIGAGANWFAYADSDPLRFVDPLGLWDFISFVAGWGDNLTFGATKIARAEIGGYLGIGDPNERVDYNSAEYDLGEWAGTAQAAVWGGAGGWKAAGEKMFGREFSHWVPQRFLRKIGIKWIVDVFGTSRFNGNYVTPLRHALHDPWRYLKSWSSASKRLPFLLQQLDRIPRVYYGAAGGFALSRISAAPARPGP